MTGIKTSILKSGEYAANQPACFTLPMNSGSAPQVYSLILVSTEPCPSEEQLMHGRLFNVDQWTARKYPSQNYKLSLTGGQSSHHKWLASRIPEELGLIHQRRVKSPRPRSIDRLEERGDATGNARRSSFTETDRVIINHSNSGIASKTTLGKRLRDGLKRIWAFLST